MVPLIFSVSFVVWVASLMAWDVRTRRLPDYLTLPGAVLIGGWALAVDPWLLAGGIGWFLLYLVTAGVMGGIGGGEIKFALGLGTVAALGGAAGWLSAVVGASLITLVLAGLVMWRGTGNSTVLQVPHGPGMGLATCAVVGWLMVT